jgi:hypothetical protein
VLEKPPESTAIPDTHRKRNRFPATLIAASSTKMAQKQYNTHSVLQLLLLVGCSMAFLAGTQFQIASAAAGGVGAHNPSSQQQAVRRAHHRRLMQPFNLGIQDAGDKTGRANQREIDDLTSAAVIVGLNRAGADSEYYIRDCTMHLWVYGTVAMAYREISDSKFL